MLLEHLAAMETGTRLGLGCSYRDLAAVYAKTLQSMLDLCETPAERLARCQQFVQRIEGALREAEAAHRDARASSIDKRHLEIQLLDTEIRLLQEKQPAERQEKGDGLGAILGPSDFWPVGDSRSTWTEQNSTLSMHITSS